MRPDGCEAILWRQGQRRCELWVMNGRGELRVFNGDQLMRLEALTPSGYARAQELRQQAIKEQGQMPDTRALPLRSDGRH